MQVYPATMQLERFPRTVDDATFLEIGEGRPAVRRTLRIMRRMVRDAKRDPRLCSLALDLVRWVPDKEWLAEITQIFYYVRDNVRYVQDVADIETLRTPQKTLELMQGDCDDQSVLLATLLQCINHPARFVAVGFDPESDDLSHVFVQTRAGEGWISLDPTEPVAVGWSPPGVTSVMIEHV